MPMTAGSAMLNEAALSPPSSAPRTAVRLVPADRLRLQPERRHRPNLHERLGRDATCGGVRVVNALGRGLRRAEEDGDRGEEHGRDAEDHQRDAPAAPEGERPAEGELTQRLERVSARPAARSRP